MKNDNVYTFAQRQGKELGSVGLDDFDDPDFLANLHNHDNDGARFVEEFLDERNTGVTNANRSQQLNAAVNLATAAGVLFVKFFNLFLKKDNKINPLIGNAGVSAVPDSARISQILGLEYDPSNYLLMHAMGPNVAGVIGSAVAAGILLGFLG